MELEKLIEDNKWFVIKEVYKEMRKHNTWNHKEDYIQEGYLGLLESYKRFDQSKGYTFLTYAKPWIFKFIRQYTINHTGVLRQPNYRWERGELIDFKQVTSINTPEGSEDVLNLISDGHNTEEGIINKLLLEDIKIKPWVRSVLVGEYTQRDISELVGISRQAVNRRYKIELSKL